MTKWESHGGAAAAECGTRDGYVFRYWQGQPWKAYVCGEWIGEHRRRVDAKRHVEREIVKPSVALRCPF